MQYVNVAVHGLIKKDGKFLVTKRSITDGYMPGLWDLPGGSVEFGENNIDALCREIKEESGIKVKINSPIFIYDFMSGSERHQFQIVYECDFLEGEVILNPDDHDEFRWVDLNEMKKLQKIAFLENLYKDILKV